MKLDPTLRPNGRYTTQMAVRANRDQIDAFARVAKAANMTLSDWIRSVLLRELEKQVTK